MYATFQPDPRFQSKSWFNERGGYIIKSTLDPITGKIIEERLAYNQPNTYTQFLNDYMKTKLR
jgi:hypothetical protein